MTRKNVTQTLLRYLFWLAGSAGAAFLMLQIRETVLLSLAVSLDDLGVLSPLRAIDQWAIILLAVAAIACVGIFESYLRRSDGMSDLLRRFANLLGWELLVVGVNKLIQLVLIGLRHSSAGAVISVALLVFVGAAFAATRFWWSRVFHRRPRAVPKP